MVVSVWVLDRVAVEPSSPVRRGRVEPEQTLCVLIPVVHQHVELIDCLPDLALSVAIDGATQNLDTPLVKIHNLLFRGMRAERATCEIRELVPHHDGPLAANAIVLVLDRHVSNSSLELVDHAIECIIIVSLAVGDDDRDIEDVLYTDKKEERTSA